MKKIYISFCFLFLIQFSFSQEWAPKGAKWYYEHVNTDITKLTIIESIGDTIINEKSCKILQTKSISLAQNNYYEYHWDTGYKEKYDFLYYQNDTIFYFNYCDNEFHPLYQFNVNVGDTITVREGENLCNFGEEYSTKFKYAVDSISTIDIGENQYKLIFNTMTPDSDWGFNTSYIKEYYPIIDKIGSTYYLFGLSPTIYISDGISHLRCYKDNTIEYRYNGFSGACDSLPDLPNSFEKLQNNNDISMITNDIESSTFIKFPIQFKKYELIDVQGTVIQFGNQHKISTKDLPNGMYIIKIETVDNVILYSKILK